LSVTQGRAAQKAGTRLVDVNYDLSGGVPPYTVTLQGSMDGGVTWTLPVTTVSGNVGSGVTAGTNRTATWNAGADWNGQISANVKIRVNVTDSATPPAPAGFELIPAGAFTMGRTSGDTDYDAPPVTVSAFYMAKYETSKALWDEVRAWAVNNQYTDLPVGGGNAADHPVHSVISWDVVKW
jgi:formylglycine-generating enzyme required for sulfatase activity